MSGTFAGIQQASTAIAASRYGLEIVNQNVANATTPGYTRQASQQAAVGGAGGVSSIHVRPTSNGGVDVIGTARLTDLVLNARARSEHARSAVADQRAAVLTDIENVFPEPRDTGLGEQLNDFWNAWGPVANDPGNDAARRVLLQRGATVVSTLNAMSGSLAAVAETSGMRITQDIDAANTAAEKLADVNRQIKITTATGGNANTLLDQRDLLLDQLAKFVGGTATINTDGTADVVVGAAPGVKLVDGLTANSVQATAGSPGPYTVAVVATDTTTTPPTTTSTTLTGGLTGGSVSANITAVDVTVPHYRAQLDGVAQALAAAVNTQQAAGKDLDGTHPADDMFDSTSGPITAATLRLAMTDPRKVAASGETTGGADLDGANALNAAKLGKTAGSADEKYGALIGELGSASSLAQQQQLTQNAVTAHVDTLRESVSGVSLDEEVSAMLTYQRSFQAASRVLTTMDDMLDTLINRTGLVGR